MNQPITQADLKTTTDLWLPLQTLAEATAYGMIDQANCQELNSIGSNFTLEVGDYESTDIWQVAITITKTASVPADY